MHIWTQVSANATTSMEETIRNMEMAFLVSISYIGIFFKKKMLLERMKKFMVPLDNI